MSDLPVISGREAVGTFQRAGWHHVRSKGSHMIMIKPGMPVNLSIPDHKELDRGTLRKLIRLSHLTVQEFIELVKS
jgi:predicted RNA binding protein YcfA (HicA-like mRNA interferase family)